MRETLSLSAVSYDEYDPWEMVLRGLEAADDSDPYARPSDVFRPKQRSDFGGWDAFVTRVEAIPLAVAMAQSPDEIGGEGRLRSAKTTTWEPPEPLGDAREYADRLMILRRTKRYKNWSDLRG